MKNYVISIQSFFVITTIVYVLLVTVFFEFDNAFGEEKNFDDGNDETTYSQQLVESECNSPCPPSAEMCIAMCA